MYDSWSKLQSGIFMGSNRDFGNYDECVKFKHESSVGLIKGKYCSTKYQPIQRSNSSHDSKFDLIQM